MIYLETLKTIQKIRGLNQSELAGLAGVTRQAVSLWFQPAREGRVNMSSLHLLSLSRGLKLSVEDLAGELPCTDPDTRKPMEAVLLWDRLYPSLEDLAVAICRGELRALARLAEVYGLFRSAKIAGPIVWERFPDYKRYLPPGRREDLERVWLLKTSPDWS